MDKKVFIECGANDGVGASETINFDKNIWRGILIEARPGGYEQCLIKRPECISVNACLVSDDFEGDTIEFRDMGLLGVPAESRLVHERYEEEVRTKNYKSLSKTFQDNFLKGEDGGYEILKVPARTLTSILEELGELKIDFFSLDVEGYELNVLNGLDVDKIDITQISVECHEDRKQGGFQSEHQPEENDACSFAEIKAWMDSNNYTFVSKTRGGWPPKYLFQKG
ncbi:MAG: putative methyltransferase [uncultured marine phage]|uniref:Putative methyltransferase n=1 Tax=uncultured marine phage TaxID=707152 RepID=A0A8D9FQM9_9VIRU|nr:MAG: putative methyltransferase [uncultured marine phage]